MDEHADIPKDAKVVMRCRRAILACVAMWLTVAGYAEYRFRHPYVTHRQATIEAGNQMVDALNKKQTTKIPAKATRAMMAKRIEELEKENAVLRERLHRKNDPVSLSQK